MCRRSGLSSAAGSPYIRPLLRLRPMILAGQNLPHDKTLFRLLGPR